MEYVQIQVNKFVYYLLKSEYKLFLIDHNLLDIISLSIHDIVTNNDIIYNIIDYKLVPRKLPSSKWCLYNKKFKLYITLDLYNFLLNNYIFTYNDIVYTFINLSKNITHRLISILVKNNDTIKYTLNYINNVIIDTQYFLQVYNAIAEKPEWFYIKNKNINYDNIENIKNVLTNLIDNINYIDDNCPDSWYNLNWWIFRGWSHEYAVNLVSKIQKENSQKFKDNFQKNPEKYKGIYNTLLDYWLNKGYNINEAEILLKERLTTFSLDKCIKKYGEVEGISKFNDRQKKWLNTLINKPNYIDIVYKRTANSICASKISLEFFHSIHKKLIERNIIINDIYYQMNNHEWGFGIKNRGGVLYDFVIPSLKYAIEFNGNRFHPNKEKLSIDEWNKWTNPWGKSAEYIYKRDKEKNDAIINRGFILDIIWENDYNSNKEYYITIFTEKIIKLYEESKIYKS